MIKSVEHLGLYCNNHIVGKSGWVNEMAVCPATLKPESMDIKKQVPGKVKGKPVKSTAKQLQERTERELAKLRSPSPNVLEIPDSSKKRKKRPGQQTLGEIIEI